MNRLRVVFVLAMGAGLPCLASGAAPEQDADNRFGFGASVGATYTDNAGRTSSAEESENSADVGLFSDIQYERGRKFAGLQADLQFQTHSYGTYDHTLVGGVAARAGYHLLHDYLTWVVEDNLGQSLIDSRNVVTPGNTQNLNIFATGPEISLPLGTHTGVNLTGRWTDVWYEDSDFANRRLSGTIGFVRQMGAHSSLSLNGSTESIKYKELPATSDYDVRSAYLSWSATGARTSLDLNAGYSELADDTDTTSGASFSLALVRRLAANTSLSLHAGRDFGDSAETLTREQGIRGVSIGDRPAEVSSDPLRSDYATVSWQSDNPRGGLTLSANWRRDSHVHESDLDSKSLDGSVQFTRRLGRRLSANIHGDYLTEEFSATSSKFHEWAFGLSTSWSLTAAVSVTAAWDRYIGSGDSPLGPDTRNYVESRGTLTLTWSSGR